MERRQAIIALFSPSALLRLAQRGSIMRIHTGSDCPADAEIVGSYFDGERNAFCLVLEHESFPLAYEGQVLPHLFPLTVEGM